MPFFWTSDLSAMWTRMYIETWTDPFGFWAYTAYWSKR